MIIYYHIEGATGSSALYFRLCAREQGSQGDLGARGGRSIRTPAHRVEEQHRPIEPHVARLSHTREQRLKHGFQQFAMRTIRMQKEGQLVAKPNTMFLGVSASSGVVTCANLLVKRHRGEYWYSTVPVTNIFAAGRLQRVC